MEANQGFSLLPFLTMLTLTKTKAFFFQKKKNLII